MASSRPSMSDGSGGLCADRGLLTTALAGSISSAILFVAPSSGVRGRYYVSLAMMYGAHVSIGSPLIIEVARAPSQLFITGSRGLWMTDESSDDCQSSHKEMLSWGAVEVSP